MGSAKVPVIAGFLTCLILGAIVLPLTINRDEKDEDEHNEKFEPANAQVLSVVRGDYECFKETGCNACSAGGQYPLCDQLISQKQTGPCQKSSAMCCQESCFRCIQDDDDYDYDGRRDRRDEYYPSFMNIDTGKYLPSKNGLVVFNGTDQPEFYNATDFSVNQDDELVPIKDSNAVHNIVRRRGRCAGYCDRCEFCGHKSSWCSHNCYCSDNNHQPRCEVISGTCYRPTVRVRFSTGTGQRINTTAQESCGMGDLNCAEDFIRGITVGSTINIDYEKSNPTTIHIKGQPEYEKSGEVISGYVFGSLFIIIAGCALIGAIVMCCSDGDCDNLGQICKSENDDPPDLNQEQNVNYSQNVVSAKIVDPPPSAPVIQQPPPYQTNGIPPTTYPPTTYPPTTYPPTTYPPTTYPPTTYPPTTYPPQTGNTVSNIPPGEYTQPKLYAPPQTGNADNSMPPGEYSQPNLYPAPQTATPLYPPTESIV